MHGPIQHLAGIELGLERVQMRLAEGDVDRAAAVAGQLQAQLREEVIGLRRLMADLHPPILTERGLAAALKDHVGALGHRTDLRVVLMDMRVPVMDGIEATAEIRTRQPHAQVVMLSAYDDDGFKQDAEQAGVLCYLVKGMGGGLIRDVLRSAVDTARGLALRRMTVEARGPTGRAGPCRP